MGVLLPSTRPHAGSSMAHALASTHRVVSLNSQDALSSLTVTAAVGRIGKKPVKPGMQQMHAHRRRSGWTLQGPAPAQHSRVGGQGAQAAVVGSHTHILKDEGCGSWGWTGRRGGVSMCATSCLLATGLRTTAHATPGNRAAGSRSPHAFFTFWVQSFLRAGPHRRAGSTGSWCRGRRGGSGWCWPRRWQRQQRLRETKNRAKGFSGEAGICAVGQLLLVGRGQAYARICDRAHQRASSGSAQLTSANVDQGLLHSLVAQSLAQELRRGSQDRGHCFVGMPMCVHASSATWQAAQRPAGAGPASPQLRAGTALGSSEVS